MANVAFTPHLQRHVACPPRAAAGATVREVLDAVFAENSQARGYILDDQGAVRQHIAIFLNGQPVRDRAHLGDAVSDRDEIYVMQALSGG